MGEHKQFEELVKPLQDWLFENGTPHDKIIITQTTGEHTSGQYGFTNKENLGRG